MKMDDPLDGARRGEEEDVAESVGAATSAVILRLPQTGRKLLWVYFESDLEAIKTQDTLQERQHERGLVAPDGARAEPVRGAAQRTAAAREQSVERVEGTPTLNDPGFPTYQTRPAEVILIDVREQAASKLRQRGVSEESSREPQRDAAKLEAASPAKTKRPDYLTSWQEILMALQLKNNETMRAKVKQLDECSTGPILFGGRGEQPRVERGALVAWWAGLAEEFAARKQRQRDEEATTEGRYTHNGRRDRSEEVVPELEGRVKERRKG
jgi:hypothetical protein